MIRRFMFIRKLKESKKPIIQELLKETLENTLSFTGRNMRSIMMMTEKTNVNMLTLEDIKAIEYHPYTKEENWKKNLLGETMELKYGLLSTQLNDEEINAMVDYLCTS